MTTKGGRKIKVYAAGRSTTFDYNDAKTRMQKAESDQIQAKYEFIFRTKIDRKSVV